MKRQLNFELIQFHVHEAACELSSLVALLKNAQGKQLSESEKIYAAHYRKQKLTENGIKVLLEHVYHHLNFAWNVRKKEWEDADRYFERYEKFPKDFDRFLPKSIQRRLHQRQIGDSQ